jgi:hypothetical protein
MVLDKDAQGKSKVRKIEKLKEIQIILNHPFFPYEREC